MHAVRLAARLCIARPGLSAAIVLTLAVGLGAVTAIFSIAYTLLVRPLPFPQADRIVAIQAELAGVSGRLALREYRELEREAKTLARVGAYYRTQYNLTGGGPPLALTCTMPSSTVFDVLGVSAAQGAVWPPALDFTRHYTIVLSHGLWQRRFGGRPDVVGQSIQMDGASYRISGVLPDDVDFPLQTDVYRGVTDYNAPHVRRYSVIARIAEGRSLIDAQGELEALSARFAATWPDTNIGVALRAVPLRDAYVGAARPFVLLMVVGVTLLLVMAAVNVTNLLLTRALSQEGDVAVRLALGASRWHLLRQNLLESMLLALAGASLGAVAARAAVQLIAELVAHDLPPWMTLSIDPGVLVASAILSMVVAIAVAILPVRQAFQTNVERVLRQQAGRSGARGSQSARRWLVATQAAVASLLLIAAGLFVGSLQRLLALDPGFDRHGALTFRTDPPFTRYGDIATTSEFYRRTGEALLAIPGVTHVGTNTNLPFARLDLPSPRVTVEGRESGRADEAPFVNLQLIDPGYFGAMRIPLRSGRPFARTDDATAPLVAVVSDRAARRFWGDADPIGRRLQLLWNQDGTGTGGGSALWLSVIGVVGSVQFSGVDDRTGLDVYAPNTQMFAGDSFFVIRAATPPDTIVRQLRTAIDQVDRDQSFFDVVPLESRVANTLWQHRVATVVLMLFAGVALVLAVLGTYAVTAHAVAAQRREIGIRRALGSSGIELAWLVTRHWMLPVAAGVLVGLIAGVGAADTLTSTMGTAGAGPWWPFALPWGLTLASTIACLVPLVRLVRRTSLTEALRAE
jgi:putative ABC transport system permease protein